MPQAQERGVRDQGSGIRGSAVLTANPESRIPNPVCLALAFLFFLSSASAQEVLDVRDWSRRDGQHGVTPGTHSLRHGQQTLSLEFVTVALGHPGISADLVVPLEGPNTAAPMERLARSVSAIAAMGLEPAPAYEEPQELRGLRISHGRLYSWPPQGPHLILHPEGTAEVVELEPGTARAVFENGPEFPLVSVNGRLPENPGEAAVYTGRLNARELPAVKWPEDLLCSVLVPRQGGADPHGLLLDDSLRDRVFVPRPPRERLLLQSESGQVTLVFRPPLDPEVHRHLESATRLTITVAPPHKAALAKAVAPCGPYLVRAGEVTPAGRDSFVDNALALDPGARRIMFVSAPALMGRQRSVPVDILLPFLESEGFPDLVALPPRPPLLYHSGTSSAQSAAQSQVRLALAVVPGRKSIRLPEFAGDLRRIMPGGIQGTLREFPANQPRALFDERLAYDPALNQFWASPIARSPLVPDAGGAPRNTVRLLFSQPRRVAVLELVHAESVGFSPEFNLKRFRVIGRASAQHPWRVLAEVAHEEPVPRDRIVLPGAPELAELRLEVLEANFLPQGTTARLAEAVLWGP